MKLIRQVLIQSQIQPEIRLLFVNGLYWGTIDASEPDSQLCKFGAILPDDIVELKGLFTLSKKGVSCRE